MIGSINGFEWVILVVVALVLIGPERLPSYAAQLGRLVRELRSMARGAGDRLRSEMGEDAESLKALDPRQYDPRRIIREALEEDLLGTGSSSGKSAGKGPTANGRPGGYRTTARPQSEPAPYDDEAT